METIIFTLRKIQHKSEFEYQVIDTFGEVVATRRSKRDYVACFVYFSKDAEGGSQRRYAATHWFGRPNLVGKGDSARAVKARQPNALALIETIRDHARPGAWSEYPLTRTLAGEPIENFEGVGISWYELPHPYTRGVGYSTAINKDKPEPAETPAGDPVVNKIVAKIYGDDPAETSAASSFYDRHTSGQLQAMHDDGSFESKKAAFETDSSDDEPAESTSEKCGECGCWFSQYDKRILFCLNCCEILSGPEAAAFRASNRPAAKPEPAKSIHFNDPQSNVNRLWRDRNRTGPQTDNGPAVGWKG